MGLRGKDNNRPIYFIYFLVDSTGRQDYTVVKSVYDNISLPLTPLPTVVDDSTVDKVCQSLDPAQWFPLSATTVDFWLRKGPDSCRNEISTNHYPASERRFNPTTKSPKGRSRRFGNQLFYSTAPNGEKQSRKWLLYSPHTGSVYCFYCTLMMSEKDKFSQPEGFSANGKSQSGHSKGLSFRVS